MYLKKLEKVEDEKIIKFIERNQAPEDGFSLSPVPITDMEKFLQDRYKESLGIDLKPNRVPQTIYFAIEDEMVVGAIKIRSELTPSLLEVGGNIGYCIEKKYRRKGHGTKMLHLALEESKKLGMKKVLITCNISNKGSEGVIIKNGGKLENIIGDHKRFWITLTEDDPIKNYWNSFLEKNDQISRDTPYVSWYFGDDEKEANELLELVLNGEKRGTCSLDRAYSEEEQDEKPKEGDYSIITNYKGEPKCIIKVEKVVTLPFDEVTEEMAIREGEGDKSYAYWEKEHIRFFSKFTEDGKKFSRKDLIIYEYFELVWK